MLFFTLAWLLIALSLGFFISFNKANLRTLKIGLVMIFGSWTAGLCMLFYAITSI